ncbi:hypothetical protein pb186bvf_014708 [Paramecium bursaria]
MISVHLNPLLKEQDEYQYLTDNNMDHQNSLQNFHQLLLKTKQPKYPVLKLIFLVMGFCCINQNVTTKNQPSFFLIRIFINYDGIIPIIARIFLIQGKISKGQFNNQFKCCHNTSVLWMVIRNNKQSVYAENVNCNLQRKVCLDCIEMHQNNDESFMISDIKSDQGIQKMLNEFKQNNISKISNIYIQCYIQQYFLILQMIEQKIINELDKFEKEIWSQINMTNCLKHNSIGSQTYLKYILQKLEEIDQAKDDYLFKINDISIGCDTQVSENAGQSQLIPHLQNNKEILLKKIISSQQNQGLGDDLKQKEINENPSELIYNIIQIQDEVLNSNILKEQYENIKNIIKNDVRKFLLKIKDDSQKAQQNKEESIKLCEEGIKITNLQKYQESLEIFEQSIKLDPQNSKAYYHKGCSFSCLKKYQEAIEAFDQAIQLDHTYAEALNQKGQYFFLRLGVQLHNLQRFQEAVVMYEQAIKQDPKYFHAYLNKGISLNDLKRYLEAIEMYDSAIKLDAKNASVYYHKGVSFQNLQRNQEAIQLFEQSYSTRSQTI